MERPGWRERGDGAGGNRPAAGGGSEAGPSALAIVLPARPSSRLGEQPRADVPGGLRRSAARSVAAGAPRAGEPQRDDGDLLLHDLHDPEARLHGRAGGLGDERVRHRLDARHLPRRPPLRPARRVPRAEAEPRRLGGGAGRPAVAAQRVAAGAARCSPSPPSATPCTRRTRRRRLRSAPPSCGRRASRCIGSPATWESASGRWSAAPSPCSTTGGCSGWTG